MSRQSVDEPKIRTLPGTADRRAAGALAALLLVTTAARGQDALGLDGPDLPGLDVSPEVEMRVRVAAEFPDAGLVRFRKVRAIAADVPEHLPTRLRVLCLVYLSAVRLRYCPFLAEIATHLGRSNSTITVHVSSLARDGTLWHSNGATRCAITEAGRTQARLVLDGEARNPTKPDEKALASR